MNVILFFLLVLSITNNSSAFFGKFFGTKSSTEQCPIKLYDHGNSSFTGVKLYANAQTFHPLLDILSDYAKRCHVRINIKRAYSPSKTLPSHEQLPLAFQLGEAIEYDLVNKHNEVVCNRLCLGKSLSHLKRLPDAKCFLRKLSRNHDFQRDSTKPAILMKRRASSESLTLQEDQRKMVQNKCSKLDIN